MADLAEPLRLEPESFDGITCSQALHYLADWLVPLRSFYDGTAPRRLGGNLARPSGWAAVARPAGQLFRYRVVQRHVAKLYLIKADVEVTQRFWRQPLAAVADAFADAGFVIDRIAEARPSPEALLRWPDELAAASIMPSFIVYRLLRHNV